MTDAAFEVLSKRMWRLALAEVPCDDEAFATEWAAIVTFCNTYGSLPSDKARESFSTFPDPHEEYASIPEAFHPYLKKLFSIRHR
jgi:hypothetical protein